MATSLTMLRFVLCALVACCLATCSKDSPKDEVGPGSDAEVTDGETLPVDEAPPKVLTWTARAIVDDQNAGFQLSLAATPDNKWAIAYFTEPADQGECSSTASGGVPSRILRDTVRYARFDGTTWKKEDVVTLDTLFLAGISLGFDKTGTPNLAYTGGGMGLRCCGTTDLAMSTKTGNAWSEEVLVKDSSEAVVDGDCPVMQDLCNVGDVVGLWPSWAMAADGTIGIAYRDIHICWNVTDQDRSDMEWYSRSAGGAVIKENIDPVMGMGHFNSLIFDRNGDPALASYNQRYGYIGFSRKPKGEKWTKMPNCSRDVPIVLCPEGLICEKDGRCTGRVVSDLDSMTEKFLSLGVGPDNRFLIAFFNTAGNANVLTLAHSTDGLHWQVGTLDADGATGKFPNLITDPMTGLPAIAYYRCGDTGTSSSSCNRNHDGVRYIYFTGVYPDELMVQKKWKKAVVTNDVVGFDGMQLSAGVTQDGKIGLAYYSTWQEGSVTRRAVMFQEGQWK